MVVALRRCGAERLENLRQAWIVLVRLLARMLAKQHTKARCALAIDLDRRNHTTASGRDDLGHLNLGVASKRGDPSKL